MKIKEGFILRKVANENVVMPIGKAAMVLNGIIKLNESGVVLWNILKNGAEMENLVQGLVDEYGINRDMALQGAQEFLATLQQVGCVE